MVSSIVMVFSSPIWLLGLLPWAAMVAFVFTNRGNAAVVPFLKLWPATPGANRQSTRRPPPIWMWLIYAASLFTILAAGGPVWMRGSSMPEISIIIDRGITMSGDARYRKLLAKADALVGAGVVTVVPVPGSSFVADGKSWVTNATALPPTALNTASGVQAAVVDCLRTSPGLVVVLSDQIIDRSDPRVMQIAPDALLNDIGIATLSARSTPRPQVMVRLVNHSQQRIVHLRVRSGKNSVERDVQFYGETIDEFIDFPSLADTVMASIGPGDDLSVDDTAWLVRQSTGIVLDVNGAISPDVQRIAAVFMRDRPVGENYRHAVISDAATPAEQEGVQIVAREAGARASQAKLSVANHPLSQGVTAWPSYAAKIQPPDDFRTVVSDGDTPLVAVHEQSPRKVWVNLDMSKWAQTTNFVVFFSNVFNWIKGDSDDVFTAIAPTALGPGWKMVEGAANPAGVQAGLWPGLYQSEQGALVAVNAEVPPVMSAASSEWKTGTVVRTGRSLSAAMCDVALVCILGALALRAYARSVAR